jgi:PAS domain S-box-containing protein
MPDGAGKGRRAKKLDEHVRLLFDLNAAAVYLHRSAFSEENVFKVFCEQMERLHLHAGISYLTHDGERLVLRALVPPSGSNFDLDQKDGFNPNGFEYPLSDTNYKVVKSGESIYCSDNTELIDQMLATSQDSRRGELLAAHSGMPAVVSPLEINGQICGLLSLADHHLTADDVPVIAGFAEHVAAALENSLRTVQFRENRSETEGQFRILTEIATSAIFIYQGEKLQYVNKAMGDITGYAREELVGMNFWDIVHPAHKDLVKERGLARQRNEDVPGRYEFKIITKNGEERWVDFTAERIEYLGKPASIGTAIDITERKKVENALREEETLSRTVSALTSTLDLNQVLDAILTHLEQVIPYDSASVFLLEGDRLHLVAVQGFENQPNLVGSDLPAENNLFREVQKNGHSLVLADAQNDPRFQGWGETGYVRGWLGVPLVVRSKVIGYLTLDNREIGAYDESSAKLAEVFANQAAIAIENARLFEAERAARDQAETLRQVAQVVSESLELNEVLRLILEQLKGVLNFATTSVILFGEKGKHAMVAGIGYGDEKLTSQIAIERLIDSPILKKMTASLQPEVISDVSQHPDWIWITGAEHVRSFLAVPIISRGRMIGALMVDSAESGYFSEENVHTAQSLAQHMAVAIENARLFEAEHTARERAEALRDAVRIISSSLSLDQVLKAVLDQLARVLPFDSGNVMLLDGARLVPKALRGYEKYGLSGSVRGLSLDVNEDTAAAIVIRDQKSLMIEDTSQDIRWKSLGINGHVSSWLGVPLQVREQIIGLFSLDRVDPGGYSEEEISLAQSFALNAAAAIENARLYEVEGKRAVELEALRQASLSLTASLELHQVLDAILKSALDLLPEANNSHIFLYSDNGLLEFGAALYADKTQSQPFSEPRSDGLTYTVARTGEPIVVPDMRKHPLYADAPPDWEGAILGLPLKIGARVVGVMNVSYKQPRSIPEAELRALRLLGDQAAIAIENARLFEQAATERRHLSLLYEIGRNLGDSLDPDKILNRAISLTCQALNGLVGQAFLYLPDEDRLMISAIFGRSNVSFSELKETLNLSPGMGLAGWVAQHAEPVYVPDVTQDPRWLHVDGIDDDVHSALVAPILAGGHLHGVLSVLHQKLSAFSNDQLVLLLAICQEVGLALSNASRYQQVKRRLAEITLIQDLGQVFNRRLELQVLLDEVATQLGKRLGYPFVEIFLVDQEVLILRACFGYIPQTLSMPFTEGVIGRVVRSGQVALIPDVSRDPDYIAGFENAVMELAVPIFHGNVVVGVINIEADRPGQLGSDDRDLLQVLAGQISIALENAVLYERVRRHAEELEQTVAQRTAELSELFQLSQKIGYTLSYSELLHLLLDHLRNALRVEIVAGCFLVDDSLIVSIESPRPLGPGVIEALKVYWREVISHQLNENLDPGEIPIEMLQTNDYDAASLPIESLASLINAPVIIGQTTAGILIACSEASQAFRKDQERLLSTFANQAAAAIERMQVMFAAEQKRLEGLVEHLPIGVVLLDSDFRILVANPLGRSMIRDLNPGSATGMLSRVGTYPVQEMITHHGDLLPLEINLEGPPPRYFEVQVRSIGSQNHQWLLTLRDVTQERDNHARIQMHERLATVGQLAAGIAHDFNNIMAAILVYADLLQNDPDLPQLHHDKLGIIQQQVERAASLIRQILDFSRRSVMDQSPLDLLPFIKELDKMFERVMPETIRTELSYHAGTYMVNADPTRLQQVFMNLALNGRDAMPDGGILKFELDRLIVHPGDLPPIADLQPGDWIRITVRDTGRGVPAEIIPHIFEPFFTTKPVGQGTGLGLAQVYGIIKQHDGFIDVTSQPGKGAAFNIYLPALSTGQTAEIQGEIQPVIDGQGDAILVVEDDRSTLQALKVLLEAHNYLVYTASNGDDALRLYEDSREPISLVISDVVMPRMGGIALYNSLQERSPGLKMLFVTGHPLGEESQALLEGGSVHWLQKPFSMQEFRKALWTLLNEKPQGNM